MTSIVVADAGPLIGMARIDHLSLLKRLYNSIMIPPRVFEELEISNGKPGAKVVSEALNAGWIEIADLKRPSDSAILPLLVDAGEAESIELALQQNARLLIIDDRESHQNGPTLLLTEYVCSAGSV